MTYHPLPEVTLATDILRDFNSAGGEGDALAFDHPLASVEERGDSCVVIAMTDGSTVTLLGDPVFRTSDIF